MDKLHGLIIVFVVLHNSMDTLFLMYIVFTSLNSGFCTVGLYCICYIEIKNISYNQSHGILL